MSKPTLFETRVVPQEDAETPDSAPSDGFESVGSIIQRMMVNRVEYGDMLHGEDRPRRGEK